MLPLLALFAVRVTPRASRDAVKGFLPDGRIHVTVTAPPANGAANAAVVRVLARALHLPPRDIVLVRGTTSREKLFEVHLEEPEIRARLHQG